MFGISHAKYLLQYFFLKNSLMKTDWVCLHLSNFKKKRVDAKDGSNQKNSNKTGIFISNSKFLVDYILSCHS
jgi:hypothetical protein